MRNLTAPRSSRGARAGQEQESNPGCREHLFSAVVAAMPLVLKMNSAMGLFRNLFSPVAGTAIT